MQGGVCHAMQELPMNYQRMQQALQPPSAFRDTNHERYHEWQASDRDTAAKRMARALGDEYVRCPCGERFRG